MASSRLGARAVGRADGRDPLSMVGARGSRPSVVRAPCALARRARPRARARGGPSSVGVAPRQGRRAGHVLGLSGWSVVSTPPQKPPKEYTMDPRVDNDIRSRCW